MDVEWPRERISESNQGVQGRETTRSGFAVDLASIKKAYCFSNRRIQVF